MWSFKKSKRNKIEACVLGGILIKRFIPDDLNLVPDDFKGKNRELFEAMIEVQKAGFDVGPINLSKKLKNPNDIHFDYFIEAISASAGLSWYAKQLKKMR